MHPETKEEYALARAEYKVAAGYHGFKFDTSTDITIEQDLKRRDITINSIAEDSLGNLIDPYGGIKDLEARLIRHTSAAFVEDPLRILRVSRFFAVLGDFDIAAETIDLMRKISATNELETIAPERIWQETQKALNSNNPDKYFICLQECGALAKVFPEFSHSSWQNIRQELLQLDLSLSLKQPLLISSAVIASNGNIKNFFQKYIVSANIKDLAITSYQLFNKVKELKQSTINNRISLAKLVEFISFLDFRRRPDRASSISLILEHLLALHTGQKISLKLALDKVIQADSLINMQYIVKNNSKSKIKSAYLEQLTKSLAINTDVFY